MKSQVLWGQLEHVGPILLPLNSQSSNYKLGPNGLTSLDLNSGSTESFLGRFLTATK